MDFRTIVCGPRSPAFAALALLPAMAGCASLDGQAVPVLDARAVTQVATAYPPKDALETFYGTRNEAAQRAHRDKVIGAYLAAADIRYLEFRRNLSREAKGSNLLLDLAVLGLTGGASLASQSTANALSAGAAGLVGTRASVSKELWFDKALPALIAAMDSRRTDIRTQILTRMQASPQAYSLAEAFSDIARYQEAATLDSAIEVVTAAANEKSIQADARYADVVLAYTGVPPTGSAEIKRDLKARLEGTDLDTLKAIATDLHITLATDVIKRDAVKQIMLKVNNAATLQELDTTAETINAKLGGN